MTILVLDDLIFPSHISLYSLTGKRRRKNELGENQGGYEEAAIIWTRTRREYDAGQVPRPPGQWTELEQFWESCDANAVGFRLQDPTDYLVTHANGVLYPIDASGNVIGVAGFGYGVPTYRTHKQVGVAAHPKYRDIRKLFGAFDARRAGSSISAGASPGQYAVDQNTGIVTFVADSASAVTAVTVGATTQVTLTAALVGMVATGRLYLAGLGGADAALLNGQSHLINSIAGTTYTLATNTAGKTITAAGSGYKYPSETLTWAGTFHTPCRFLNEDLDWSAVTRQSSGLVLLHQDVPIIEIRL